MYICIYIYIYIYIYIHAPYPAVPLPPLFAAEPRTKRALLSERGAVLSGREQPMEPSRGNNITY